MSNTDNKDQLPADDKAKQEQQKPEQKQSESKTASAAKPAEKAASKKAPAAKEKSSGAGFFIWFVVLLLCAAVGAGGYFGWQFWQQDKARQAREAEMAALIESQNQQILKLASEQQTVSASVAGTDEVAQTVQGSLQAVHQRLDAHNKRLISISSTSRDDWLLAEAEYLLRLANQRLLTERATKGSQGLLETADKILAEMDDVDLFPIRQAIGEDLAALKLAPKVDRDGLFLRMAGLAKQIDNLPTLPKRVPMAERNHSMEEPVLPENVTWQHRMQGWATSVFNYLKGFVHIRRNQPVNALLPPEAQAYVKLNLRFMIERAQLAMLREEKVIYETSIQQAREWLQNQFPPNSQIEAFILELDDLEGQEIIVPLPDITSSLEQLRVYIERLHKVKSTQPQPNTQSPQASASEEA
ncbi:uroporphyrinogen-III C-methyltransferase [uncultured Pseudoteredinibacter sp.]|uniref:uroporphyrinogen-III C-methyltransferase n=1 Tax=uncultured Pseudoteredinibacter sp. TaxID=1641701 RepID=UPI00261F5034|nr:uroporphyrinogen-III C-methyltransferase [uncultured Pseudoteredinibacter sp.]